MESAMALKYALFHLGKVSDKIKPMLNTERLILADLEEAEKMSKGKKKKEFKKHKKESKKSIAFLLVLAEELEKEADPNWLKAERKRKMKHLGLE